MKEYRCPRCHSLFTEPLCPGCEAAIALPLPTTTTLGQLGVYKWPDSDDVVVVILSKPDENDEVGIYILPENRRVPAVDVRPFTED